MKNYALPGLYEHYIENILFLNLLKSRPEYFIENANINAIFGNF